MFTGIIEELGVVTRVTRKGGGVLLTVRAPNSASELSVDDSISISGVCQTVIDKSATEFTVEAVEETLRKTTLGTLDQGEQVNLELAMRLNDRLGGHLVLGHVDGVGTVVSVEEQASSWLFQIELPKEFLHYVIAVGSIAIDGVSLTIARIEGSRATVSIIPHTFEHTTFRFLKAGMKVNIEFDLVGKYIERMLARSDTGSNEPLSFEKLRSWGYSQ